MTATATKSGTLIALTNDATNSTVTGLTACTNYQFSLTGTSASNEISAAVSITKVTNPLPVTEVKATVELPSTVVATWKVPKMGTDCSNWLKLTLSPNPKLNMPLVGAATTGSFYDVDPGTYTVKVYTVTKDYFTSDAGNVKITVREYSTTTSTVATTIALQGGKYTVTLLGKVYDSAGNPALYKPSHATLGSAAFNAAEKDICDFIKIVSAQSKRINDGFFGCKVDSLKNGSLVVTAMADYKMASLPILTNALFAEVMKALLTSAPKSSNLNYDLKANISGMSTVLKWY
ncbi:unnamed protein product [Protopolystoma xenopodis]|uniref:Uncharacterized protein n=1 Tax=Protopolystoma xenopodis TaxID=117903 RepID=A0A448WYM2_9PLAT|nr:unnamed protein product [Protopolystoma xenopodis]